MPVTKNKTAAQIAADKAKQAADAAAAAEATETAEETVAEGEEAEVKTPAENGAAKPAAAAAAPAAGEQANQHVAKPGPGQRYLDAFGEQGAVWFVQGLSFEEAQTKFAAATSERIKALQTENATLKTAVARLGGEQTALSSTPEATEQTDQQRRAAEMAAKTGNDNHAKIAAAIKLPK